MKDHLVSCILATHNDGRYLTESIRSILDQTYKNIECVVIDDGSTDDTATVVQRWRGDPRFFYFPQSQSGVAKARNTGAQRSSGAYLAFLDADDRWDAKKLETQLRFMRHHQECSFCWSDQELMDDSGKPLRKRTTVNGEEPLTTQILTSGWNAPPSCWLVKRDLFQRAGGFDERLASGHEDVEMIFKMAAHGQGARCAEAFVWRRVRPGSISRETRLKRIETLRAFELMLSYEGGKYSHLRNQALHTAHRFLAGHCWENGSYWEAMVEALRAAAFSPGYIFERSFIDNIALGHVHRLLRRGKTKA